MESRSSCRRFMNGKLVMSFYRAAKPASMGQYGSKVKANSIVSRDHTITQPKQKVPSSTASVDFIIKQDQVTPQPKQKVSFFVPDSTHDSYHMLEDLYGVAGDESVDLKTASYISTVQERFRLERTNSEYKRFQDMQH